MANLLDRSLPPASDLETLVNFTNKAMLRLVVIDNEQSHYLCPCDLVGPPCYTPNSYIVRFSIFCNPSE